MKVTKLVSKLDEMDRDNIWLYSLPSFRILFPFETDNALKMSLRRHVASGILTKVSKNLYANARAKSFPAERKLEALVEQLKPHDFNYVSRESRLSELGRISQMPISTLTLTTTGNSKTFDTEYGVVEFIHTKRKHKDIVDRVEKDPITGLWVASEALALEDLKNSGRNTQMLNEGD